MIVPNFWAEARTQHRSARKRVTIRRYGWSMTSEDDALAMAEQRVSDALRRILIGETVARSELKRAYNGSDGVPIREEVLSRYGEEVVTRNAYGAHCLNSPRALFADIDFSPNASFRAVLVVFAILAALSIGLGIAAETIGGAFALLFISLLVAYPLTLGLAMIADAARGGAAQIAYRRIHRFIMDHPAWNVRVYRTPAGYRLLATHRTFGSEDPEVKEFFTAVATDPVYVRMCMNQKCFRARLTGKPWRMGIKQHMRPRPGVWPVRSEHLAIRNEWVAAYEKRAPSFAACRFVESLGSGVVHTALKTVVDIHDRESNAQRAELPLA